MKIYKLFIIFFSLCLRCYCQSIDSVTITIAKTRDLPYGPWHINEQISDSLSGGFLIKSLYQNGSGSSWNFEKIYSYLYSGNSLTEKSQQNWDGLQWVNERKWIYSHSAVVDSIVSLHWNSGWQNDSLHIFYHNSSGLDSVVVNMIWDSTVWVNCSRNENVFASDSSFIQQTIYSWDAGGSQWQNFRKYQWFRDSLNRDTLFLEQDYANSIWVNSYEFTYNYLSNNLIYSEEKQWYNGSPGGWDINSIDTIKLDSSGRQIFFYSDYFPGGFGEIYNYYNSSNVRSEIFYHFETQGGFVNETDTQLVSHQYPGNPVFVFPDDRVLTICSNDSVHTGIFTMGGAGHYHYSWSPAGYVDNDTIPDPYIIADSSVVLIVTATDSLGNTGMDSVNIIVHQSPVYTVQNFSPGCIGCHDGEIIFHITTTSPYSFQIYPNSGLNITGDSVFSVPAGVYQVCISDLYCSICFRDTVTQNSLHVDELQTNSVRIFPNPASDEFKIEFDKSDPELKFELFDLPGHKIKETVVPDEVNTISLKFIPPGFYFCVLSKKDLVVYKSTVIVK
jgi:hypothetical protein